MVNIPDALLQDTISVEPYQGNGAYGPVYGAAVEIAAYVEPGFRRVANRQGEEVVASVLAICNASTTIAALSRVTWDSNTYRVIDAQRLRPNGATHHQEVYLQGMESA